MFVARLVATIFPPLAGAASPNGAKIPRLTAAEIFPSDN
jgi:hypothetical protein